MGKSEEQLDRPIHFVKMKTPKKVSLKYAKLAVVLNKLFVKILKKNMYWVKITTMCISDNNDKKKKKIVQNRKKKYLLQSCNGIMCIAFHLGIKKDLLVREKTWKGGNFRVHSA